MFFIENSRSGTILGSNVTAISPGICVCARTNAQGSKKVHNYKRPGGGWGVGGQKCSTKMAGLFSLPMGVRFEENTFIQIKCGA